MALEYPVVNGNAYEWSDSTIYVAEIPIIGTKEIAYNWTMKPELVYGTHPAPFAMTRGKLELSGSVTLYLREIKELRDTLGDGFAEVFFAVRVQYDMGDGKVITDEMNMCRLSSEDYSASSGPEALARKCDLAYLDLVLDGKRPYKKALSAAA